MASSEDAAAATVDRGSAYVAAIGINDYRDWPPLRNAARDAQGAMEAFIALGFKPFAKPLIDRAATRDAMSYLVTDELRKLGRSDSLVLFFAGHGHTLPPTFSDAKGAQRGYIIPADAQGLDGSIGTWLKLESWLGEIAHLPPRHILVILDACHSGIALDPATRWRNGAAQLVQPLATLRARRSRRILTSALDDEVAMDGGPIAGHSLFTGCLIEALRGELFAKLQRPIAAASELWTHVRERVFAFSSTKSWKQTPEFGRLDFDDHGELIVELPIRDRGGTAIAGLNEKQPVERQPTSKRIAKASSANRSRVERSQSTTGSAITTTEAHPALTNAPLHAAFTALDRHNAERMAGATVLSVIAGDSRAPTTWAAWAARRGYLTLLTESATLDAAISDLLSQSPWLRSLSAARMRIAVAAQLSLDEVDAQLDARSTSERSAWIDHVVDMDRHAQVSGWLLSALREPRARVPDLTTAPVQGGELLAVLCDLAAPIAVLIAHHHPTAPWLEAAIRTAARLVTFMPRHSVAVAAPSALVTAVLRDHNSAALSMARQGVVSIANVAPTATTGQRHEGRARSRAEQMLHAALSRDPRTAGHFALNVNVPTGDGTVEVDLVAQAARLAVEIDGWYHFREPQGYRRDRSKDVLLQRAGFFVMRFLAEDVEDRLASIVDEIAIGLSVRRAAGLG